MVIVTDNELVPNIIPNMSQLMKDKKSNDKAS